MSYFMVPLGLYQAGRKTILKTHQLSQCVSLLLVGWDANKEVWVKDYETTRRKRGAVVPGR